jgi:hypothetical protein
MTIGDPSMCIFCGQYIYNVGGCANWSCPSKQYPQPTWPETAPLNPPIPYSDPFAIQNLTQRITALEEVIKELTEELRKTNTRKKKLKKVILKG